MKIVFFEGPKLRGSGGEIVDLQNKEYLQNFFGYKNFASYQLCYGRAFGFNYKRPKTYIYAINEILKLIAFLYKFKPEILFFGDSIISVPSLLTRRFKVIVFFHNIEKRFSEQRKDSPKDIEIITAIEKSLCKNSDARICLNRRDSLDLKNIYGFKADLIIPVSIPDSFVKREDMISDENYMLFVGTDFFGNTEGLFWFIEKCLDDIACKLIVIGTGMEKYQDRYPSKNVEFLGFVPSLSAYYSSALLVVAPIISGAGMKTKVCEALMYGKYIFGTNEAFEGYDFIDEADSFQCNTAEDFIFQINQFLSSKQIFFSQNSRNCYLRHYSPEAVKNIFYDFLRTIC